MEKQGTTLYEIKFSVVGEEADLNVQAFNEVEDCNDGLGFCLGDGRWITKDKVDETELQQFDLGDTPHIIARAFTFTKSMIDYYKASVVEEVAHLLIVRQNKMNDLIEAVQGKIDDLNIVIDIIAKTDTEFIRDRRGEVLLNTYDEKEFTIPQLWLSRYLLREWSDIESIDEFLSVYNWDHSLEIYHEAEQMGAIIWENQKAEMEQHIELDKLDAVAKVLMVNKKDLVELLEKQEYMTKEDLIEIVENGDIRVFDSSRGYLCWRYDDFYSLRNILHSKLPEKPADMSVGELLIKETHNVIKLSSGKVVYLYA